jgi:hypothetical protein
MTDTLRWPSAGVQRGAPATTQDRLDLAVVVELLATGALLVAALRYLLDAVRAAGSMSLWTDEIYSIHHYSGRGPWTTLTTYNVANNHIFFNLLNSLTPGAGSFDPLHARFWSIAAVLGMLVLAGYELFRRRWFLAGGMFVFVVCVNEGWLDLALQARGYGLLGFCSTAAALWVWRYLEHPRQRWLTLLALVTLAGTWSVPTFVLFAGPLWLVLLAIDRTRRVFVSGAVTLAAILAAYLPVQSQLRAQLRTYGRIYGHQFGSITAVWTTLRTYVEVHHWPVVAVEIGVLMVGLVAIVGHRRWGVRRATAAAGSALFLASGVFLLACRVMTTPAPRTASFVVWPLVLGALLPAAELLARARGVVRAPVAVVVAVLLVPTGWAYPARHHLVPVENWRGAGSYIARTFPDGTEVYTTRAPQDLRPYLRTRDRLVDLPPAGALRDGDLVVVDTRLTRQPAGFELVMEKSGELLVEADLVQQRGLAPRHHIRVVFAEPADSHLLRATVDGHDAPELIDHDLSTTVASTGRSRRPTTRVELVLAAGTTARSLVLVTDGKIDARTLRVTLIAPDGGRTVLSASGLLVSSSLVTVPIGDRQVSRIEIASRAPVRLREAWVYAS